MKSLPSALSVFLVTTALACTGEMGASDGAKHDGKPSHEEDPPGVFDDDDELAALPAFHPGPRTFRRLTNAQYANTLRDALGVEIDVANHLSLDRMLGRYTNGRHQADPSAALGQAYGKAAASAAAAAVQPDNRTRLFDDAACADACLDAFVDSFGRLLFRRPVEDEERDAIVGAAMGGSEGDFWAQAEVALEIMLQSVQFLYLFDNGQQDDQNPDLMRRDQYGIATRLSLLLWNRGPDRELLDLADRGALASADDLHGQVARMIDDARFVESGRAFFREWLGYDLAEGASKSERHSGYTHALAASLVAETDALVEYFLAGDLPIMDIFAADFTFADEDVRSFYQAESGSPDRARLPAERGGILGHASFIAANSGIDLPSPTLRGLAVLERFMCGEVASPPADAPDQLPEADDAGPQTVRERTEMFMLGNSQCRGCHQQMDNIGFLFEHFDVIGRYRSEEPVEGAPGGGKPVSALGAVPFWGFDEVDGLPGLAEIMRSSPAAAQCLRRNLLERALGRAPVDSDARTLALMERAMNTANGTFSDAVRGLAGSGALFFFPRGDQPDGDSDPH